MKKKVLAIALAVALLAIMVSGSLAYFTAEDKVTNTFTIGSVMIEIWENEEPTDTDVVEFEDPMLPVVDMDDLTNDPGYFAKVVKVENTGENAAFIRAHIAVPTALVGYLDLNISETGWSNVGTTTANVDGVDYTVYTYDHEAAVDPEAFTAELLQGAYLNPQVDLKDNPDTASADLEFCKPNGDGTYTYTFSGFVAHNKVDGGYTSNTLCILVASEAIQAQGFEAGGATAALNAGFGAGTNPWA